MLVVKVMLLKVKRMLEEASVVTEQGLVNWDEMQAVLLLYCVLLVLLKVKTREDRLAC